MGWRTWRPRCDSRSVVGDRLARRPAVSSRKASWRLMKSLAGRALAAWWHNGATIRISGCTLPSAWQSRRARAILANRVSHNGKASPCGIGGHHASPLSTMSAADDLRHDSPDSQRRSGAAHRRPSTSRAASPCSPWRVYHFTWDLEFFGYRRAGLTAVGGWKLYARCIASTFLFLAGVSLFLAHGRWRSAGTASGAASPWSPARPRQSRSSPISPCPSGFIFFGILHQIALASLLGLLFLRLPAAADSGRCRPGHRRAASTCASAFVRSPGAVVDRPVAPTIRAPTTMSRVFPWFGAVLVGIAAARTRRDRQACLTRLAQRSAAGAWSRPLVFAGRHSLAFYLIHQPVLIGCVWLVRAGRAARRRKPRDVRFPKSCAALPADSRDDRILHALLCLHARHAQTREDSSTRCLPATRTRRLRLSGRGCREASARSASTTRSWRGRYR